MSRQESKNEQGTAKLPEFRRIPHGVPPIISAILLSELNLRKQTPKSQIDMLLAYIASADLEAAEKMLKNSPDLVLEKGDYIQDFSAEIVWFKNFTPFQYALFNEDPQACDMLKKYLPSQKVIQQYDELFPAEHSNADTSIDDLTSSYGTGSPRLFTAAQSADSLSQHNDENGLTVNDAMRFVD